MQTLKKQAIEMISNMPEPVDLDDIMYGLYVIDKIRKGKDAAGRGETLVRFNLRQNEFGLLEKINFLSL